MMQCVVVDDEPLAISLLTQFITKYSEPLELIHSFSDALESIDFINQHKVDILFLDIQMPDILGIELLKKISPLPPAVIFTTAHRDYALAGYEIGVVDYLLKPFSYDRFSKAIKRATDFVKQKETVPISWIFVKSEYKLVKINLADIVYIESLDDYIRIYLAEGRPIITLMSLKSFSEKLPAELFVRVHRRFIIAIDKISSIAAKKINLQSEIEIPIGDTFQPTIQFLRSQY